MALSRACMSLSLRRAWIEMSRPQRRIPSLSSRSPYGERGLKYAVGVRHGRRPGRSPYGERGLKYRHRRKRRPQDQSLSLRRAWIEIRTEPFPASRHASLSLRRAWIEIRTVRWQNTDCRSLSLRRAWIEIFDGGWRGGSRGGRSPYGERGLKYRTPDRGMAVMSRSPYGERGLKFHGQSGVEDALRRSPYGERGLKFAYLRINLPKSRVALLTESVD